MRLDTANMSILATSPVVGEFNGYNLAAVVVCLIIGIRPDEIRKSLEIIQPVPGREMIQSAKGFSVVVDSPIIKRA
jgi:UDP-N-acetylmuramyl tripeptide synthase